MLKCTIKIRPDGPFSICAVLDRFVYIAENHQWQAIVILRDFDIGKVMQLPLDHIKIDRDEVKRMYVEVVE